MANTGKKIVLTLQKVTEPGDIPLIPSVTKVNTLGDPDYIPPAQDLTSCPVTNSTACPTIAATGQSGQAEYEFALPNAVLNNPAIAKVKVALMNGSTEVISNVVVLPHGNYFTGTLSAAAGSYTINILYLDSSNAVVATCLSVASVTIT
jgi:hypothetical protein